MRQAFVRDVQDEMDVQTAPGHELADENFEAEMMALMSWFRGLGPPTAVESGHDSQSVGQPQATDNRDPEVTEMNNPETM
jgi:hypothetical protein